MVNIQVGKTYKDNTNVPIEIIHERMNQFLGVDPWNTTQWYCPDGTFTDHPGDRNRMGVLISEHRELDQFWAIRDTMEGQYLSHATGIVLYPSLEACQDRLMRMGAGFVAVRLKEQKNDRE